MRYLALLAALAGASALAQGFNLNVNIDDGTTGQRSSVSTTVAGDAYELRYETDRQRRTLLKVVEPEGARCEVLGDNGFRRAFEVPFSFEPKPDRFYKVVVYLPDGSVFEKKIEAKAGQVGVLSVHGASGSAAINLHVHEEAPPPPPPPPAAPAVYPMGDGDFASLCEAIEDEGFAEQKVGVLRTAADSAYFTTAQVGKLVDLMAFSEQKVEVVAITKDKLVDRQNAFQLYKRFSFSEDKDKVKRLLGK
ncbi:MAG: DUF4476 domain-containing protein [Myxococcota bacterium]